MDGYDVTKVWKAIPYGLRELASTSRRRKSRRFEDRTSRVAADECSLELTDQATHEMTNYFVKNNLLRCKGWNIMKTYMIIC